MNDEELKKFLEDINPEHIHFKHHFYEQIKERPITEELVRAYLRRTHLLASIEEQKSKNPNEEKYKVWIKLSNKCVLVIIMVRSGKLLYIITGWNTSRKWKKLKQK